MKILVTGGLGYIGSHVTVALLKEGYDVTVVDSLVNSRTSTIDAIERITNKHLNIMVECLTKNYYSDYTVVFHFAAHKDVGESMEHPRMYYQNNLKSLLNITRIPNIIFSSSCAAENPISPYGHSKKMCEQIVKDCFKNSTILRYHNPVGNTPTLPSSNIGLLANLENCEGEIEVFGNDYPTKDGTCERDFINIHDIVDAHLLALERIGGHQLYTLGRGIPVSVKDFILEYNHAKGKYVQIKYGTRRDGDIVTTHSTDTFFDWNPKRNLFDSH